MSGRSIRSIRRIRGGDINLPAWQSGGILNLVLDLTQTTKERLMYGEEPRIGYFYQSGASCHEKECLKYFIIKKIKYLYLI